MNKQELAEQYFLKGCNCCQAVCMAFKDEVNLDEETLLKLASGFGGGISRLRETCGCVSGMVIILNLLYGYDNITDKAIKDEHYKTIQQVILEFESKYSSLVCRDLLNLKEKHSEPISSVRTKQFYQSRPCLNMIKETCSILEKYIKERK